MWNLNPDLKPSQSANHYAVASKVGSNVSPGVFLGNRGMIFQIRFWKGPGQTLRLLVLQLMSSDREQKTVFSHWIGVCSFSLTKKMSSVFSHALFCTERIYVNKKHLASLLPLPPPWKNPTPCSWWLFSVNVCDMELNKPGKLSKERWNSIIPNSTSYWGELFLYRRLDPLAGTGHSPMAMGVCGPSLPRWWEV